MKKYILLSLLIFNLSFGQNPEIKTELPTVIPPSPSVAALMKFEEIPVSNYTGIPDISIPLFSSPTHSKDINFNLELKYHSGVDALDRASDVGLGWSLISGGTISRTVRGLPDEQLVLASSNNKGKVGLYNTSTANHINYYYQHNNNFSTFVSNEPFKANKYLWEMVEWGKFDTEHDLWQFNFLGNSGRFIIEKNIHTNQLEVKPADNYRLKIVNHYSTNNYIPIGFTIFDEKGYSYLFDVVETTLNKTAIQNDQNTSISSEHEFKSAFHLSKVYDNNNKLILEFIFSSNSQYRENTINTSITSVDYFGSQTSRTDALELKRTLDCFGEFKPFRSLINSFSNVSVKKISQINIINFGRININYQQGRLDTNLNNPDKAIYVKELSVFNLNNQIIKKFGFNYDYSFVIDNRMLLSKIEQIDVISNKSNSYEFSYYKNNSDGYSIGKDYWGYFNLTPSNFDIDIDFSNRPSPEFSTTNLLQKIKYPTGGCVIFDFGANTYSYQGNTEIEDFFQDDQNIQLTNITSHNFNNTNNSLYLGILSNSYKKIIFSPSIVNHDISNASKTFLLMRKVNNDWVFSGKSFYCQTENCSFEFYPELGVEYKINYTNLTLGNNETETLSIAYYSGNFTNKFLKGAGHRINSIGYFDIDVPNNYYQDVTLQSQFTPSRKKKFDYNMPFNNNKSSGSLVFAKPLFRYEGNIKIATQCPEPPFYSNTIISFQDISYLTMTSFNNLSILKTQGSDVGYKHVIVHESDNGSIEYEYTSPIDFPEEILFSTTPPFLPSKNIDYKRGLLVKEIVKDKNMQKNQETINTYEFLNFEVKYGVRSYKPNGTCYGGINFIDNYEFYIYAYENQLILANQSGYNSTSTSNFCGYPVEYIQQYELIEAYGWAKLKNKTTKNYFYPNGSSTPNILETNESYTYNPVNKKISESTVSNSKGETLTTKYFYHTGNSIHSQNRISEIERIETYRASELLSKSQIIYNNNWTNNVSFLPKTIVAAKGSENFEARLEYLNYDEFGNPLEIKQDGGTHICYIWGYNKTQPIAKIENATYVQVQPFEANLQTLSNGNNEQNLINALNSLRTSLPNAMITTYTYKPLIGISTVTDPKGDKQTYHYDSFNRLQYVKDAQGNIVSENEYNYKN